MQGILNPTTATEATKRYHIRQQKGTLEVQPKEGQKELGKISSNMVKGARPEKIGGPNCEAKKIRDLVEPKISDE